MLKIKSLLLVILIIIFLLPTISYGKKKVRLELATLDWEPYIGKKLKDKGYVARIIEESFKIMNHEVRLKFYTWARTVNMAKDGLVDGYFPEYYAEDLKEHFMFSKPFNGGPVGFFKKKITPITYQKLKDLKLYTIGVVRGYVNTSEFDSATFLKKSYAKNDLLNFRKLIAGRVDLVLADKYVGFHLVKKHMRQKLFRIEFMDPPLESKDLYVCFSKKVPESYSLLKAFNEGLKKIQENGTFKKILEERGF